MMLLCYSLAVPKVEYVLRSAPCFYSTLLESFDCELRSTLSDVLNISFEMESTWLQASLPVKFGGIGVRSVVMLAPSAFLASAAGTSRLINRILPVAFHSLPYLDVSDAFTAWQKCQDYPPPPSPSDVCQKAWDNPIVLSQKIWTPPNFTPNGPNISKCLAHGINNFRNIWTSH